MAAAVATRVRRRRTFAQQQAAIRQRTVDAADTTNWSNPVAGNANLREIELEKVSADDAKTKKRTHATGRDLPLESMHANPRRDVDGHRRRPVAATTSTEGTRTAAAAAAGERKNTDRRAAAAATAAASNTNNDNNDNNTAS